MIRNLMFDLGGVIMDIDKTRCIEAFRSLGMSAPEKYFGDYSQTGPFMALEAGKIDIDTFHSLLRDDLPDSVTDADIDSAFCRFLIGIPEHRLDSLRRLRGKYRIGLLSNTNPIMWRTAIADEFRQQGLTIDDYFDGIVTSFEAKAIKPDRAIFGYAVRNLGFVPEETIFIDDSADNLRAAADMRFHTVLAAPGTEFVDMLRQRGITA